MDFDLRLDNKSRMSREVHVRFCEGLGVRFPRATRLLEAYRAAWSEAEILFQILDEEDAFRVERIPQGTHIVRLHVAATNLLQFSERLRKHHILLPSPAPGEEWFTLKVNPSIIRVPAAELAAAFRAAIQCS